VEEKHPITRILQKYSGKLVSGHLCFVHHYRISVFGILFELDAREDANIAHSNGNG
jgi:hypothetical protein